MKKRYFMIGLAVLACAFTGCSKDTASNKQVERVPGEEVTFSGTDYVTIGESDAMLLLIEPTSGNIRWQNKETGKYYETKLVEEGVSNSNTLSDLVVKYFSGSESDKYSVTSEMNSYDYGVEMDTMSYEAIDNGIRVVYDISSDTVTYKDFPAYVSEERLNNLVLQYLDEKGQKAVLKQYRLTNSGIYARTTNKDQPLSGMAAPQLYNYFYTEGHYTYDELAIDNAEYDKEDETPVKQSVVVSIEYYLDGDDLVVRIPTGEIQSDEEYPIKSLEVLPYFLSSKKSDGYLFVPDGSGALIYLDNHKTQEYQFSSRYYGGDVLIAADTYNSSPIYMAIPVYGIKSEDTAVLGIIEKGAEVATLETYINGYYSDIPLSHASLSFSIRDDQTVASYSDSASPFTLKKVSDDYYSDDIQIRYCFLNNEEANYSGMANAYKNYLVKKEALAKNRIEEEAPLFIELLGEIDKEEYFFGIPYEGTVTLTTFDEARNILAELTSKGIKNIKVDYDGIVNEGMNQRALKSVKVANKLGGKSGLKSFMDYAQTIDATVFPNINLQTVATSNGLSKNNKAFFMSGEQAQIYSFNLVTTVAMKSNKYATYIVSPTYIADYVKKFETTYSKLGIDTLSSDDFFTFISANYKKGQNFSMTNAIPYYHEALETITNKQALMLSNPINLAYDKVTYITDLPTDSSEYKILDASVPFMQMVLDGYVTYSSKKLNNDSKDLTADLMKAIETKSSLKFTFMATDTSDLEDTTANDVFMAEYSIWNELIAGYYKEYNEFYQEVKDATIVWHEIVNRDTDTVMVTYSNGIQVYLNYSDSDAVINGVTVGANNYIYK